MLSNTEPHILFCPKNLNNSLETMGCTMIMNDRGPEKEVQAKSPKGQNKQYKAKRKKPREHLESHRARVLVFNTGNHSYEKIKLF